MPETTDRIAEQIERSVGDPPPSAVDLDGLLRQGRQAQLRRRLALGAGTAAAALVIGGGAWALAPGDDTSAAPDNLPVAGEPTADGSEPSPSPRSEPPADSPDSTRWLPGDKARYSPRTGLEVRPGWTLVDQVEHPAGPRSWAVEVRKGERLAWFIFTPRATFGSDRAPEPGYRDFAEWVQVNGPIAADMGDGPDPTDEEQEWPGEPRDDLVEFGPDGTLQPVDGTTVLAEQTAIDLGASFAPAGETAVAEVEKGGERWYVVARQPGDYIAVPAAKGGETLDAFIEFARGRYAEGGGGLL